MRRFGNAGDVLATDMDYHEADDSLIVKRTQDVEPILDANKAECDPDDRRYSGDGFHRVASVPLVVVEQWRAEGIDVFDKNHWPAVRRKLNSNEYRYLRTKPGVI